MEGAEIILAIDIYFENVKFSAISDKLELGYVSILDFYSINCMKKFLNRFFEMFNEFI